MRHRLSCLSVLLLSSSLVFAQAPAPSPASAVASTQSSDLAVFQKLEDNWSNAVNNRDQYGLELVLSPLFIDVAASGEISTRNQQLAQTLSGEDKTLTLDQKVITVRMLGDIAVANGTYTLHHKTPTGEVDEKGVFTHVFERVRGGWICVNSQRTAVARPASKDKSKHGPAASDTPFHFPLFK